MADSLFVHHSVMSYVVNLTMATRTPEIVGLAHLDEAVELGVSPRATLGMLAAARATALLRGRSYVLPADVAEVASDVMSHRLMLSFDAVADGVDPRSVVAEILAAVAQPTLASREVPNGPPAGPAPAAAPPATAPPATAPVAPPTGPPPAPGQD